MSAPGTPRASVSLAARPTVAVWFDGGGVHGLGNVRRSHELVTRLGVAGFAVVERPLSASAAHLVGGASASWDPDATPTDLVVLDVPGDGGAWVQQAKADGALVLALDYAGGEAPDLIVSLQAVRAVPHGVPHHVGLAYAIIRSELRLARDGEPTGPVLVMLGGGASAADTVRVVRRVAQCASDVVLVQGPMSEDDAEVSANVPSSVHLVREPPDLAQWMARCAWAVTTGGTSLLELLHLGRPVFALPRTPEESTFVQSIAAQRALLGVGEPALRRPSAAECVDRGRVGEGLIDGRGCERIAALLWDLWRARSGTTTTVGPS